MLVLLSPAKSLDWTETAAQTTTPRLMKDTGVLMNVARRLSVKKLRDLMDISDRRQSDHEAAMRRLEAVAEGKFGIAEPTIPTAEERSSWEFRGGSEDPLKF